MARYVILSEIALTDREWERLGCSEFTAAGYEILAADLRKVLRPSAGAEMSRALLTMERAVSIESVAQLEELVSGILATDVVLVFASLSSATRPLFLLLRRYQVRYSSIELGVLPVDRVRSSKAAITKAEYVTLRLDDFFGMLYRWRRFMREVIAHRFEYFRLQPPWLFLTAGTIASPLISWLPFAWRARRIHVASFDCLVAETLNSKARVAGRTAVFLDEAFCNHPDFEILGLKSPVTPEKYWRSLHRLFSALEAKLGLTVIIAPHPKSGGPVPAEIQTRMFEKGNTAQLVRDSELVLCHASTSVSFAVLFRKPLLFVTTDEVERSVYRGAIARMSSCFALRRVNTDRFKDTDLVPGEVDEQLYKSYEHLFLRAPDARGASPWTILRNEYEAVCPQNQVDSSHRAGLAG